MLKMYTAVKWQRSILPKARNVIQLWFTFHVDNSFLLYRMPKKNARYPTIYARWVTPKLRLCRYRELCKVWKGFLLDLWHLILRETAAIEKKSVLVLSNQTVKIWEQMQLRNKSSNPSWIRIDVCPKLLLHLLNNKFSSHSYFIHPCNENDENWL